MHEASFHRKDKINGVIFFHRHKFHEAMSITSLRREYTESHTQLLSDSSTGGAGDDDGFDSQVCILRPEETVSHHAGPYGEPTDIN